MAGRFHGSACRLVEVVRFLPGLSVVWLIGVIACLWRDAWWPLTALLASGVGVVVFALVAPRRWHRWVADPVTGRRIRHMVRLDWQSWMVGCGLSRQAGRMVKTPGLGRMRWRHGQLTITPVLLPGQTVDDVDLASERLRVAAGARRLRVMPNPEVTGCQLVFGFGESLTATFPAAVPGAGSAVDLDRVPCGVTEDGETWLVQAWRSTLVVGATGAGKASVMWGVLFGLGPAIKSGLVQVHGVDLKGGMELAMGAPLCRRHAHNLPAAVVLLEDAARDMQTRARQLAGLTRQHMPTLDLPLVVVVIDELAALIAYASDRDLIRRAETALTLLLTQGRAVGYAVWGFAQDPRKDTIAMRHLFAVLVALRLNSREEVAMVLGDGALNAGAAAYRIPADMPGVGYVLADGRPVKVRAGQVTDTAITECARRWPSPVQVPIDVPDRPAASSPRRREQVVRTQ